MSESIGRNNPREPGWRMVGTGMAPHTFGCIRCGRPRAVTGRRKVRGMWWCAGCVTPKDAAK